MIGICEGADHGMPVEPGPVGVMLGVKEACPGCVMEEMDWPFCAAWAALAATSSLRGRPRFRRGVGVAG